VPLGPLPISRAEVNSWRDGVKVREGEVGLLENDQARTCGLDL